MGERGLFYRRRLFLACGSDLVAFRPFLRGAAYRRVRIADRRRTDRDCVPTNARRFFLSGQLLMSRATRQWPRIGGSVALLQENHRDRIRLAATVVRYF